VHRAACALYASAITKVVPVKGTREAELTKLLENIFRCVNIALVNEMKLLCERMNIDLWEVIDAAKTKPFGFMPFYPGPGLGGHCIPIDPFYLTWKAREFEFNTASSSWRRDQLADATPRGGANHGCAQPAGEGAEGRERPDPRPGLQEEHRRSAREPSIRLIELFRERGAQVSYHDPYCPKMKEMRHQPKYMLRWRAFRWSGEGGGRGGDCDRHDWRLQSWCGRQAGDRHPHATKT